MTSFFIQMPLFLHNPRGTANAASSSSGLQHLVESRWNLIGTTELIQNHFPSRLTVASSEAEANASPLGWYLNTRAHTHTTLLFILIHIFDYKTICGFQLLSLCSVFFHRLERQMFEFSDWATRLTSHSSRQTRGSQKTECSAQSACPTRWLSYRIPKQTKKIMLQNRRKRIFDHLKMNNGTLSLKRSEIRTWIFFSPQRQKCFLSRRGRGPETGRQLCDRGNFAAAGRFPRPIKHTCRRRCRSESTTKKKKKKHRAAVNGQFQGPKMRAPMWQNAV